MKERKKWVNALMNVLVIWGLAQGCVAKVRTAEPAPPDPQVNTAPNTPTAFPESSPTTLYQTPTPENTPTTAPTMTATEEIIKAGGGAYTTEQIKAIEDGLFDVQIENLKNWGRIWNEHGFILPVDPEVNSNIVIIFNPKNPLDACVGYDSDIGKIFPPVSIDNDPLGIKGDGKLRTAPLGGIPGELAEGEGPLILTGGKTGVQFLSCQNQQPVRRNSESEEVEKILDSRYGLWANIITAQSRKGLIV